MEATPLNETSTASNVSSESAHSATSHLWFCEYPSFSTQLLFFAHNQSQLAVPSTVSVYDADGFFINEAKVAFGQDNIGTFDLEVLTAGCKLESGLKHGHLVVTTPPLVFQQSRLVSMRDAWINNAAKVVNRRRELFYPLRFAPDRSAFLALVNQTEEVAELRVRAFCGSRSPRTDLHIPAMGARVFNLDTVFPEYGYLEDQALNAYVRISSRAGGSVSCFFMERLLDKVDSDIFQAVC